MADSNYQFPIMDTIETAWAKVSGAKATVWAVMGLLVLNLLVFGILGGVMEAFLGKLASQIPTIIGMFVQLILTWGLIYIGIQRAQDKPIFVGQCQLMFDLKLFFKMLGVYLLQFLAAVLTAVIILPVILINSDSVVFQGIQVVLGLIWYVVLIYVLLRIFLAKAIVIDQRLMPWTAVKLSWEMTKGNVFRLFVFVVVCLLVFVAGFLLLGIGAIWTIPFMFIAYGVVYRRFLEAFGKVKTF